MDETIKIIRSMSRKQLEDFTIETVKTAKENKRIAEDMMRKLEGYTSIAILKEVDENDAQTH